MVDFGGLRRVVPVDGDLIEDRVEIIDEDLIGDRAEISSEQGIPPEIRDNAPNVVIEEADRISAGIFADIWKENGNIRIICHNFTHLVSVCSPSIHTEHRYIP